MALKDRTKRLLAGTLTALLDEKPLDKIHVTEICREADVQNQVFYYHFRDKYDLVAWMFYSDFSTSFSGTQEDGESPEEFQLRMMSGQFRRMWERREFYRRMFTDKSQNSLERYIHELDVKVNESALKRLLGRTTLTGEERYVAAATSYACLGMTIEWILGRFDATPEDLAHYQLHFIPDLIMDAYRVQGAPIAEGKMQTGPKAYRL